MVSFGQLEDEHDDDDDEQRAELFGQCMRQDTDPEDGTCLLSMLLAAMRDSLAAIELMTMDSDCADELRQRHQALAGAAVVRTVELVNHLWQTYGPDSDDDEGEESFSE